MTKVTIYSDGACSGNPGPGGYGVILRCDDPPMERELSGGERNTTNNRMELMGAIVGLESLKKPATVEMVTDSQYVAKGATEWIDGWIRRGWRNASKKPVANRDLWERLLEAMAPHDVTWTWVRGHAGHPENERCDALAVAEIEHYR
ncbi:MAG: ribonuclease HI [Planctomycetota bacterium]